MRSSLASRIALSCLIGPLLVGSCAGNQDEAPIVGIARLSPATVSSTDAWRLFDQSMSSGFVPDDKPVLLVLDRAERIVAVKVRGPSPFVLEVRGRDGAASSFAAIDLSKLTPAWHTFAASDPFTTSAVELRFHRVGAVAAVPEIELWATTDDVGAADVDLGAATLPAGFVATPATSALEAIDPDACKAFKIPLARSPTQFRRAYLTYESEGLFRPFGLERSVNGHGPSGGAWLSADPTKRTFVDEIDPGELVLGTNDIKLCVPDVAKGVVEIAGLRLVAELETGGRLHASINGGTPRTPVAVEAGESLVLGFDRLIAPDALVLKSSSAPKSIECLAASGASTSLTFTTLDDSVKIDGGASACAALSVKLDGAATIDDVDVLGSGARERVDWPRIVVTSPAEHFGNVAWVGGFIARPAAMTGALRIDIGTQQNDTPTGDFGKLVERTADLAQAWTVDVAAHLPDGTTQKKQVVLDRNSAPALAAASGSAATSGRDPKDTRFGKLDDAVVTKVRANSAAQIRVGSDVGLDIPAGGLTRATEITGRRIAALPPLDAGMVNVTAPQGHAYEFLPHGQRFAKDIEVTIPFDPKLIPEGKSIADVNTYYFDTNVRHWRKLPRKSIDFSNLTTRSTTNHFTVMIDAVLAAPATPTPLALDPTAISGIPAATPSANVDMIEAPTANATGDARVALPIRIPAGRGAYTPALSLKYSSAGGPSWVGMGWDVSSSAIEIDTRWGTPQYTANEEPRYVMDGQELVPTSDSDGPTCTGALRFHARVEGAFSHILRCGTGPADYRFELRDRNGTLYVYGGTAESVVASYRPDAGIFRWLLREVTDVHGNKTTFRYKIDQIAGIGGSEPARQAYLEFVDYTAHDQLPSHYQVQFVFDNGARPDRIINGRAGFKMVTRYLLRAIRVKFDNEIIREYVLTYDHGQFGKSVLTTVGLYGLGGCAAGSDAFQLPTCTSAKFFNKHEFTYYSETEAFDQTASWPVENDPFPAVATLTKGDSKTTGLNASLGWQSSSGGGSVGANGSYGTRKEIVGFYDINGDGLVDQVFTTPAGLAVLYNQMGSGNAKFSSSGTVLFGSVPTELGRETQLAWGVDASFGLGASKHLAASASGGFSSQKSTSSRLVLDFDGDGFTDIVDAAGTSYTSTSCTGGQCFSTTAFEAADRVDPTIDPLLDQFSSEMAERMILGDPVVQWVAPYSGTVNVAAYAQRRRAGGVDGVTLELYKQDALLAGQAIAPSYTSWVSLTQNAVAVTAGEAFYVRIKTGDDGITKDGTLNDETNVDLIVDYTSACVAGTCRSPSTFVWPPEKEPTGAQVFHFEAVTDMRVNATQPFMAPARGNVQILGTLTKQRSSAPLRVCVQRFRDTAETNAPCNSTTATLLAPMLSFAEAAVLTQPLNASGAVEPGDFIVVRVESDLTFDPKSITFAPYAGTPSLYYTQVCIPDASPSGATCYTDAASLAKVKVDTSSFGLFTAPASPPAPAGAMAISTLGANWPSASWQVDLFSNPLYPEPITVTVRSADRGTLGSFNCTAMCGRVTRFGEIPPMSAFTVYYGESISFDVTAANVSAAPYNFYIPGYFGNGAPNGAPAIFRQKVATPPPRTPFVGGYRSFYTTFWNEADTFAPATWLADFADPTTSNARLAELSKSAVEPIPYFNATPVYPLTSPEPTWAGPGSAAFITSTGRANAANLGAMQEPGSTGASGIFSGDYARMTCTRAFYAGMGLQGGEQLVNIGISSLNATLSASTSETTTDVVDMNGDGIADVIAGERLLRSTLRPGTVVDTALAVGNRFRRRAAIDYSLGFGGEAAVPVASPSGHRRDMATDDPPDYSSGFHEGLGVGRSATTDDLMDINGDGLPDLVRRQGLQISVRYNLGGRFDAVWEPFGDPIDATFAAREIDEFEAFEKSATIAGQQVLGTTGNALTHETTLSQSRSYTIDAFFASATYTEKTSTSRTARQLADLNGDGLPDLLFKKDDDTKIHVQFNLGSGFGTPREWTTTSWGTASLFPAITTSNYAELLTTNGTKTVTGPDVLASSGTQESFAYSATGRIPLPGGLTLGIGGSQAFQKDTYELGLVDVNGDGAADHVFRRSENNNPQYMYVKTNLVTGKSNLLDTIKGPLGSVITLDYASMGNTVNMPHRRQVLSSVTVDDGLELGSDFASPPTTVRYAYLDGFYSRLEKQFFGFSRVFALHSDDPNIPNKGVMVTQYYENRNFTLQGSLVYEARAYSDGQTLVDLYKHNITREARDVLDAGDNVIGPHSSCTTNLHALLGRLGDEACTTKQAVVTMDEETRFEGAVSKKRTIENTAFDRFANLKTSIDRADDAISDDDTSTTIEYENNTAAWILGRPTDITVSRADGVGGPLRYRHGVYNPQGRLRELHVRTAGMNMAITTLDYDAFGNLKTVTTPPNDDNQAQTYTIDYDTTVGTYPVATRDLFNYVSTVSLYDFKFGVALTETDSSGSVLRRELDDQGRLRKLWGPYDGTDAAIEISYFLDESGSEGRRPRAVTTTKTSAPADYSGPTLTPDLKTVMVTDGLGRPVQLRKTAVVGNDTGVATGMTTSGLVQRDRLGRATRAYHPFFTGAVNEQFITPQLTPFTETTYDHEDRPTRILYPGTEAAKDEFVYTIEAPAAGPVLFRTQKTDPNGNKRETYTDHVGRTRYYQEHPDAATTYTTTYDYLPTGELKTVSDNDGNTTSLGYDLRGLLVSMQNPDTGLISHRYDLMGNRIATQEPNHREINASVEVRYYYDRNRLETIDYPSKTDVSYTYIGAGEALAGRGRVKSITDGSGVQEFVYGKLGEVRTFKRTVPEPNSAPIVFTLQTISDSFGRQLSITYPDGIAVKNTYDEAGNLASVQGTGPGWTRTYASNLRYDVFGNRVHLEYPNGAVTNWHYDTNRLRLTEIKTTLPTPGLPTQGPPTLDIQALTYGYDLAGNPTSITNSATPIGTWSVTAQPGPGSLALTYDGVDRLRYADGSAQFDNQKTHEYDQWFEYDDIHNIVSKKRIHVIKGEGADQFPGATNINPEQIYSYNTTWSASCAASGSGARPHLPDRVSDGSHGLLLTYDCSGNPRTRNKEDTSDTQTLTWDDDGRLVFITQGSGNTLKQISYTYDANGNRVKRATTNRETIFSSQYFDLENDNEGIRHIFAGDLRVASEFDSFPVPGTSPRPYFFHADHHGSTGVLTDKDGGIYQRLEYFVDGEEWINRGPQTSVNGYQFNGNPVDPDTKFYDYGQRYYDPRTSLFLGTDPAFTDTPTKSIGAPMFLSVSAFTAHNPLRYLDPDGREIIIRTDNQKRIDQIRNAIQDVVGNDAVVSTVPTGGGAGWGVRVVLTQTDAKKTTSKATQMVAGLVNSSKLVVMESIDPRNARDMDRSADEWLDKSFRVNTKSRGDIGKGGGASTLLRPNDVKDEDWYAWWDGKNKRMIDAFVTIDYSKGKDLVPGKIADKVGQTDGTMTGHELFHVTQGPMETGSPAERAEREQAARRFENEQLRKPKGLGPREDDVRKIKLNE